MYKKVLFIFPIELFRKDTFGLVEKAVGILRGATSHKIEWKAVFSSDNKALVFDNENIDEVLNAPYKKVFKKNLYTQHIKFWSSIDKLVDLKQYKSVYVRYGLSTPTFVKFLSKMKDQKVVLEIPTYPFLSESKGVRKVWHQLSWPLFERALVYCDYVFSPTYRKEYLLQRPSIHASNGVDSKSIRPLLRPAVMEPWVFAGSGQWSTWHGVDRLIKGAASFDKGQIEIRLSGQGPALESLIKLAQDQKVVLKTYPPMYGKSRDDFFKEAHLGIGTLSSHRRKVKADSSLKHKMYLAYRLPFLATERDDQVANNPLVYQVADNDKPIDIAACIFWLQKLDLGTLSDFSLDCFSWRETYKEVYKVLS